MIRILFLSSTLEKVGPTKQLYYILKYIDKEKFTPFIMTLSPEPENSMWNEFEQLGLKMASLNLSRVSGFLFAANRLDKFIESNKIDIIHSHFIRSDNIASKSKVKKIVTIRYNPDFINRKGLGILLVKILAWQHYKILKKADSVISCSKSLSQYFYQTKKLNYKNISNSVDINALQFVDQAEKDKIRNSLCLSTQTKIFMTVDSIIAGKNVELIINSFIDNSKKEDILLVAGKSPILSTKYSKCPNIIFLGHISNFNKYLSSVDYFISGSLSEGMPNAVLEAMAYGLPVILSDIEAHKEIVKNSCFEKYLFKKHDKNDLIQKIETIKYDDYARNSNCSKMIVETKYNAKLMTEQYQKEYINVLYGQKKSGDYQICTKCIMDTSDPTITFDDNGVCHHCSDFNKHVKPNWHPDSDSRKELEKIMAKVKTDGNGRDFDCLLGISGGVDSSYMLHLVVKEFGLRPLVFHVDGGWNSELAVKNIESMVEKLKVDLYTEVINWEEMRDFQLAFFKSGIRELDIPQDHAFIATIYKYAEKNNIKYILNGGNFSTECVMPPREWLYYGTDMSLIKDIHNKFGKIPLKTYPLSPILKHKFYLKYIKGVTVVKPLNYFPYIKKDVIKLLTENYGWKEYPQKHFESRFTKFFEGYWLPEKFGIDMRRIQLSSLILTDQMSRDEALKKMESKAFDPDKIAEEFEYIAKKLCISVEELRSYFNAPNKSYKDYKNNEWFFVLGAKVMQAIGMERAIRR